MGGRSLHSANNWLLAKPRGRQLPHQNLMLKEKGVQTSCLVVRYRKKKMKIRNFSIQTNLLSGICLVVLAATAHGAGVSGAIFTTTANGSTVNSNLFNSKCAVYLDGGPGPNAPARAAGLPDGDYFFQVTDPSGAQLLSTDPVSNRRFRVVGGVITAYTGFGGPAHATGIDQDHAAQGAITISLANTTCPNDYLTTPNVGNVYKVWATPVASYVGSPSNVDNPCGNGCFHGFLSSQSKTDNFKAQAGAASVFSLVLKKVLNNGGTLSPLAGWIFTVTDPNGVTNTFVTDSTGQITVPQLVAGAYSVSENVNDPNQPPPFTPPLPVGCSVGISTTLNGTTNGHPVTFTWSSSQPGVMTVEFVNQQLCIG